MTSEWSPRAERELMQLRDYIAQDSPFYARQFTERLIHAVERLTSMPRSGRTVPEAGHQDAIREVIYRIRNEQLLQFVTLLHGAHRVASGVELLSGRAACQVAQYAAVLLPYRVGSVHVTAAHIA